jgi:hypothetical protein
MACILCNYLFKLRKNENKNIVAQNVFGPAADL